MSELLFDAFLRTLENDGLRADVRDQARLQLVFSARGGIGPWPRSGTRCACC